MAYQFGNSNTSSSNSKKERIGYINFSVPFNKGGENTNPKLAAATLEAGNKLHELLLERYREGGDKFVQDFLSNIKVSFYDIEAESGKESGLAF